MTRASDPGCVRACQWQATSLFHPVYSLCHGTRQQNLESDLVVSQAHVARRPRTEPPTTFQTPGPERTSWVLSNERLHLVGNDAKQSVGNVEVSNV